ncbi:hypothetical protein CSKR_101075 [Clonorchis sinensis]|uniref:Uncharacterized protein n=1 Tax=Clonorchis sinensis TaxID=79923 RepID=A0A419QHT1_CLOSI|nr:hypothetical protein CSKR_101075 [Clonorchis sinensis]
MQPKGSTRAGILPGCPSLDRSANLLTGGSVVRTRPLPLDFPLLRLGKPGVIPALVLLPGSMAARHRKSVTDDPLSYL